jgi:hypothetical protein
MKTNTTTTNEYETAATDFLSRNGLKFRATLSDSKTPAWAKDGEECGHHYRVTLSRPKAKTHRLGFNDGPDQGYQLTRIVGKTCLGAEITRNGSARYAKRQDLEKMEHWKDVPRLVFDFWSSIADAQSGVLTVSAYSVLACISGDAYPPETFADFCAEYGYESDSIKALQMFRRCDRFAKRLRAFFTESELQDLSEIQ